MSFIRTIIALGLIILTSVCLSYLSCSENIKPKKSFSTFPKKIGDWRGTEKYFDQKIYHKLGVDDSVLCSYKNHEGYQIELYIGFYQSQREGDLIHSPKNCMPGAGWNFIMNRKTSINIGTSYCQNIKINNVLLQNGSEKQICFIGFKDEADI